MNVISLQEQPDQHDFLWKYMNIHKFLSFMIGRKIFYSRLDQLEDAYEGINQKHLTQLLFHERNASDGILDVSHPAYERFFPRTQLRKMEAEFKSKQKLNFVTCWIAGSRESAGMWNLYSEPGSVAIKIRYQDLKKYLESKTYQLESKQVVKEILYGKVTYRDFRDNSQLSSKSFLVKNTAFRKDISFSHENEFRVALTCDTVKDDVRGIFQTIGSFEDFPIEIVMHPKSAQWHVANVSAVVNQFAPTKKVRNSELKWR